LPRNVDTEVVKNRNAKRNKVEWNISTR